MKVLFYPPNQGQLFNSVPIKSKISLPLSPQGDLNNYLQGISSTTKNVGNIIHHEAVGKTFSFNVDGSCGANLYSFYIRECEGDQDKLAEFIGRFDCVVLSFASLIRRDSIGKNYDFEIWCEIIDAIKTRLYVFGVGIQEWIEDLEVLPSYMMEFLSRVNSKASVFGARGKETEKWCHKNGFDNCVALGCPSLYVYSRNILNIEAIRRCDELTVNTAGYLSLQDLRSTNNQHSRFVKDISKAFNTRYVFQNDIYSYNQLCGVSGLINEATGEVNKEILEDYYSAQGCGRVGAYSYWHFRNPAAWRQHSENCDFYFGDRFHGGVTSLQAGRPSLFVCDDLRVREMTEYAGLPAVELAELVGMNSNDIREIAYNKLSTDSIVEMKETYLERATKYFSVCSEAGLPVNKSNRSLLTLAYPTTRCLHTLKSSGVEVPEERSIAARRLFNAFGGTKLLELLVVSLVSDGKSDQSALSYRDFLENNLIEPSVINSKIFFRISRCFENSELLVDALSAASMSIDFSPTEEAHLHQYARMLVRCGSLEKAAKIYEELIEEHGGVVYKFQLAKLLKSLDFAEYRNMLSQIVNMESVDDDVKIVHRAKTLLAELS